MSTNNEIWYPVIPDWSPPNLMSPEQIKLFYKFLYEQVWNKGDLNSVRLLYPYFKSIHAPSTPWTTQDPVSPEQFRTAFPDVNVTLEEQILEADCSKIVTRWTALGTHTGALFDIPPTGKQVTVTGITIRHLFIDRASRPVPREMWVSWDVLGLMKQLGV